MPWSLLGILLAVCAVACAVGFYKFVYFLSIGYGFAVNKQLFDIQNQLFLNEGKINLVNKLNKITPKNFLTDVNER